MQRQISEHKKEHQAIRGSLKIFPESLYFWKRKEKKRKSAITEAAFASTCSPSEIIHFYQRL